MATKKTPAKKPVLQQADLFSDPIEVEETPQAKTS
jgi:hypothetical protein